MDQLPRMLMQLQRRQTPKLSGVLRSSRTYPEMGLLVSLRQLTPTSRSKSRFPRAWCAKETSPALTTSALFESGTQLLTDHLVALVSSPKATAHVNAPLKKVWNSAVSLVNEFRKPTDGVFTKD